MSEMLTSEDARKLRADALVKYCHQQEQLANKIIKMVSYKLKSNLNEIGFAKILKFDKERSYGLVEQALRHNTKKLLEKNFETVLNELVKELSKVYGLNIKTDFSNDLYDDDPKLDFFV